MKKLVDIIFVAWLLVFVVAPRTTFAQSNEVNPAAGTVGHETHCLAATRCTKAALNSGECVDHDRRSAMHRAKLTNNPADPVSPILDTYVVECFSYLSVCQDANPANCAGGVAKGGLVSACTTGSSALDRKAFCSEKDPNDPKCNQYDFYSILAQPIDKGGIAYTLAKDNAYGIFKIDTTQKTATKIVPQVFPPGQLPTLEWTSYTPNYYLLKDSPTAHDRRFLAYQPHTIENGTEGQAPAQQQETLNFATEPQKCQPFSWDPEGRLFDAATLEPIPNGSVMLYKKYEADYQDARRSEIGIANPFLLSYDGGFNFIVADGTYKLTPQASNYTFPVAPQTNLNSNVSRIYTQLYPAQTGEEIIQKGALEHRDIPMQPNTPQGYRYDLHVYSLFPDLNKVTGDAVFQGRVSHPFSLVKVYSLLPDSNGNYARGNLVYTGQADKFGIYSVTVSQASLAPSEILGDVIFEKIDLTKDLTQKTETLATSPPVRVHPILNYIEGVAYSQAGDPVSNGTVQVRTTTSGMIYSQVKTNSTGQFILESRQLPSSPYALKYITALGVATDTTTTRFMAQNVRYIIDHQINTTSFVGSGKPQAVNPTSGSFFTGHGLGVNPEATPSQDTNTSPSFNLLLLLVIIAVLIVSVAGILYIYIQKRNTT